MRTWLIYGIVGVAGGAAGFFGSRSEGAPTWVSVLIVLLWFTGLWRISRRQPGAPPASPSAALTVVLRGYDIGEVDAVLARIDAVQDPAARASLAAELRGTAFTVVLRGYDRGQVDAHLRAVADALSA
ncbi:DivIVA domain-containing protein [Catenuloplanes japonicus]|uniref:DivIVA domain-containing protein n=1 Tax=Catenuloplanes japonicus TaxID=33876 RepID=UPI000690259D|nr:DivIVA domain-containing protein [Catenuloplanes japonicus]